MRRIGVKKTFGTLRTIKSIFFKWIRLCCCLNLCICLITTYSCSTDSEKKDPLVDSTIEYSITYNGNGHTEGDVPIEVVKYKNKEEVKVLKKSTLLKDGFIFKGWNTMSDGNGIEYAENSNYTITTSNVVFYAQWLSEIVFSKFISSNVSVIDILNVAPREDDNWYHASVDIVNGTLTLNDGPSTSKLQFQYKGDIDSASENKGYLRVIYNLAFHAGSEGGRAIALSQGSIISSATFMNSGIAEISGLNHNWEDVTNRYIPVQLTIDNNTHFGYIKVSFKDSNGQLTIHATAYNMIAEKNITAGQIGE